MAREEANAAAMQGQATSQIDPYSANEKSAQDSASDNNLTRPEEFAVVVERINEHRSLQAEDEEAIVDFDSIVDFSGESYASSAMLSKGDLVRFDYHGTVRFNAVFLGISDAGIHQFYTYFGYFLSIPNARPAYRVKNIFTLEDVNALRQFLPPGSETDDFYFDKEKRVPEPIALRVLTKFHQFKFSVAEFYRTHARWLGSAHDQLAHETDVTYITVEDIATRMLGNPKGSQKHHPDHVLSAIEESLIVHDLGFFHASYRTFADDHVLGMYSKEDVATVHRVHEVIRAYREAAALRAGGFAVPRALAAKSAILQDFASKAREIIEYTRTRRRTAPDGHILSFGPPKQSATITANEKLPWTFSRPELDLIRVLKLHGLADAFVTHPTLKTITFCILQAAGAYAATEDLSAKVCDFLVELGVLPPFNSRQAVDHFLGAVSKESEQQLLEVDAKIEAGLEPADAMGLQDSMYHLRRDLGDMTVFCVDSYGTVDVDDAISIESIPNSNGEQWIHGHVAHISSFITPDSLLGRLAAQRISSQYLPTGRLPMFSSKFAGVASLTADKPALTFSARLDRDANILETRIEPTILRKVRYYTPQQIDDEVFGCRQPTAANRELVRVGERGASTTDAEPRDPIPEEEKHQLRAIRDVSLKLRAKQPAKSFFGNRSTAKANLRVNIKEAPTFASTGRTPTSPILHEKDPDIIFDNVKPSELQDSTQDSPARGLLEQVMILSGVVAGRWAYERGIPVIYTGSRPAADGLESITLDLRAKLEENPNSDLLARRMSNLFARVKLSSTPIEQKFLGETYWAKVTSPLRRYTDLVSHWQIDAVLRAEAASGQEMKHASARDVLPFSKPDLDRLIDISSARARRQFHFSFLEHRHWIFQLIRRAVYHEPTQLPKPLLCVMNSTKAEKSTNLRGRLQYFDIAVLVLVDGSEEDGQIVLPGELWEVEFGRIDTVNMRMFVKPIRRVSAAASR